MTLVRALAPLLLLILGAGAAIAEEAPGLGGLSDQDIIDFLGRDAPIFGMPNFYDNDAIYEDWNAWDDILNSYGTVIYCYA